MRFPAVAALALILPLVLSGCAGMSRTPSSAGNKMATAAVPPAPAPVAAAPANSTAEAMTATGLGEFLDPAVARQLTEKEKAEAASAQFYALQFGRPGAPRVWQGDSGASGEVLVGPYVRVNELDCRDFSHAVKTSTASSTRSGTACREADGSWNVVQLS